MHSKYSIGINFLLLISLLLTISCGDDTKTEKKESEIIIKDSIIETEPEKIIPLPAGDHFFGGLIDRKYGIRINLIASENEVKGTYYYLSQKKELELKGKSENGKLELDEIVNGKVTGHFSGKIYGADSAIGVWKSPKGKELPFVFYASTSDDYIIEESIIRDITLKDVEELVAKFEKETLPFEYETLDPYSDEHSEQFTDEEVRKFIDDNYYPEEEWSMYTYYYGKVYYTEMYIAIVYTAHYHPGAFGVDNQDMMIMTFTLNGNYIDQEYLGCNCYDSNLGSNDYYSTSDHFRFTVNGVEISSENIHAILFEEDGTEPFEEITEEKRTIKISADGRIND